MFEATRDSQIFVLCPSQLATGGPESLHLMVQELRRFGRDAKVVYLPKRREPIHDAYRNFDIAVADKVVDLEANLLLVPEVFSHHLRPFTKIQKAVWWLSVDNYTTLVEPRVPFDFSGTASRIRHLVGSEYAKRFLASRGVTDTCDCSSYVNRLFTGSQAVATRDPVVLYNPKKRSAFFDRLTEAASDLQFRPIAGLDRTEVAALLARSRVYVDFGPHPGKERLPREAAAAGCCVITGRRGSAAIDADVPIDQTYKLDDRDDVPAPIASAAADLVRSCVDDYDERIKDFSRFRDSVLKEKARFDEALALLFGPSRLPT